MVVTTPLSSVITSIGKNQNKERLSFVVFIKHGEQLFIIFDHGMYFKKKGFASVKPVRVVFDVALHYFFHDSEVSDRGRWWCWHVCNNFR